MPRSTRLKHVTTIIRRAHSVPKPTRSSPQPIRVVPESIGSTEDGKPLPPPPPPFAKTRGLGWVFSSLLAGGIAFYSARLYVEARKPAQNPGIADISNQKDVAGVYESTADNFDSEVGFSECLMGINGERKKLAEKCTGHVLEVSCGTGRNLGYYAIGNQDGKVESLTLVDLSPQMIEVCKKKWQVLRSTEKSKLKPGLQVRFMKGSALGKMPLAPGEKKYDSIIQTIGLCSTPSPVDLLVNLVNYLDTSNPEARILLLEHGRSDHGWLNNILDNSAEKHAEIHGCWFNRDIGEFVEEAARKTGLEVVSERRRHFGTTWVYELKPRADLVKKGLTPEVKALEPQQSSSWRSWIVWK